MSSHQTTPPAPSSDSMPSRRVQHVISQHSAASASRRKSPSGYVSPYPPLTTAASSSLSTTAKPMADVGMTVTTRAEMSAATTSTVDTTASQEEDDDEYERGESDLEKAQKIALIEALNEHRINTLRELRRIERIFADLGSSDLTQPMTAAWVYFVNSNSLLTELRALTKNYPISSDLLTRAKSLVHTDPSSNRSWNYCWLILAKIHTENLIPTYAHMQAERPEMWGGRRPTREESERLTGEFVREWGAALRGLLGYWERAPVRGRGR